MALVAQFRCNLTLGGSCLERILARGTFDRRGDCVVWVDVGFHKVKPLVYGSLSVTG